jgi:hypothetical protein
MPTVEFSSNAFSTVMGYTYGLAGTGLIGTVGPALYTPILAHNPGNSVETLIAIYRGTKPTTRPSTASAYDADRLMYFIAGTDFTTSVGPSSVSMSGTTHTCQIITQFVNAQDQSGTATWFALWSRNNSTLATQHWMTGTIGTAGSGADLIMSSTTITLGQPYKIANLTLTQSSIFNY